MLPVFPPLHQGLVGGTGGATCMENTSAGKKLSRERSLQRRACKTSPGIACISLPSHRRQNEYSKERREAAYLRSMTGMKGVYTDEYSIYARLERWGYAHESVNHGRGEYARDEDGDGFCEVHVNTMEGFWSLLRSWLRPHRGISQEKLPLYLGFFAFVHNVRRRGKALLGSRIELLVSKDPGSQ